MAQIPPHPRISERKRLKGTISKSEIQKNASYIPTILQNAFRFKH